MSQPCDDTNAHDGSHNDHLVYVIDDDAEVRRSLHFLMSTAGFRSWPFTSASDFLENLPHLEAAPIVLEIRMPEIDGIELIAELLNRGIKWPVIVLTGYASIPIAVQVIKLGAVDLLEKPLDFGLLKKSLYAAVDTLYSIKTLAEGQSIARRLIGSLTQREFEVLKLLIGGLPNKIAAHRLGLSVRTVEMHRSNALLKLKVKSMSEVVFIAADAGIKRN